MINLMPYDQKKQLHAAHMNVALIKYLVALLIASAFLAAASVMTFVFLQNNNIVKNGDNPLDFSSQQVTKQGEILHLNLVNAGKIFNQQVKYSMVMTELAKTIPTGAVLNKMSTIDGSLQTNLNLQIFSESNMSDEQLINAFKKSALFLNFNITSTGKNKSGMTKYPNVNDAEVVIKNGSTL